jgi:hypothetical protein
MFDGDGTFGVSWRGFVAVLFLFLGGIVAGFRVAGDVRATSGESRGRVARSADGRGRELVGPAVSAAAASHQRVQAIRYGLPHRAEDATDTQGWIVLLPPLHHASAAGCAGCAAALQVAANDRVVVDVVLPVECDGGLGPHIRPHHHGCCCRPHHGRWLVGWLVWQSHPRCGGNGKKHQVMRRLPT